MIKNILMHVVITMFIQWKHCYGFIICPYCDPNYMAYPNLEEAMRGYDVPMGNPNPGRGNSDPGIRNQIFSPMFRNEDGYYKLDMGFVTANHQIKCDATWSSEVFENFKDYVQGKVDASTTGLGIEIGPSMNAQVDKISLGPKAKAGASLTFPPMFSRSWSNSEDIQNVMQFFAQEHGTVVTTEAVCLTNNVNIGFHSKKVFVQPFIDAVKALEMVEEEEREQEFKRFINEFGTHYASTSEMGTKLTIERRYSAKERATSDVNDMKNCNKLAGAKIFGLQAEQSHFHCKNKALTDNEIASDSVDRMIITTYGSFIAKSLAEWSKQVISLVQGSSFSPRVIRRELRSILHLFTEKNFGNVTLDNGDAVNTTAILYWMRPMMERYCEIFELDCNKTGCGIDDTCTHDEWCSPNGNNNRGYSCLHRNMTVELNIGRKYVGEVDQALLPNGDGVEYYPSGKKLYAGHYKHGLKDGGGEVFLESGVKFFEGNFSRGMMDGDGTLYDRSSGKILYRGKFKKGEFDGGMYFDT